MLPIKFIAYINNAPSIELNINLIIHFIGIINIFPKINKKQIHAKKIIKLSICHILHSLHFYEECRTNIT